MRVGTLAARNSDGEYQINFTTNTFMGRLKSTLLIGKYPYEAMEMPFELSPIDFVAKGILLLAQAPKDCTCSTRSTTILSLWATSTPR